MEELEKGKYEFYPNEKVLERKAKDERIDELIELVKLLNEKIDRLISLKNRKNLILISLVDEASRALRTAFSHAALARGFR